MSLVIVVPTAVAPVKYLPLWPGVAFARVSVDVRALLVDVKTPWICDAFPSVAAMVTLERKNKLAFLNCS